MTVLFNPHSGTAINAAGSEAEIQASQFRVLNAQTPYYPESIDAPVQSPFNPWFITGGGHDSECGGICYAPDPPYDPGQTLVALTENDLSVATGNLGDGPYNKTLLWEGQRALFRRIKEHPNLKGLNPTIDVFYGQAESGKIGQFVAAEQLLEKIRTVPDNLGAQMKAVKTVLEATSATLKNAINSIGHAETTNDTLSIYREMDSLMNIRKTASTSYTDLLNDLKATQATIVEAAISLVDNLPSENTLEKNLKDVSQIYLQTVAQGIFRSIFGP